jgi:hypothetical protein
MARTRFDGGGCVDGSDVARVIGERQRLTNADLVSWTRASGRVRAGWHLSKRRHRHHAEQCNGADAQPDAGSSRIDGLSKGYAHGGDASSWNLRDRDSA